MWFHNFHWLDSCLENLKMAEPSKLGAWCLHENKHFPSAVCYWVWNMFYSKLLMDRNTPVVQTIILRLLLSCVTSPTHVWVLLGSTPYLWLRGAVLCKQQIIVIVLVIRNQVPRHMLFWLVFLPLSVSLPRQQTVFFISLSTLCSLMTKFSLLKGESNCILTQLEFLGLWKGYNLECKVTNWFVLKNESLNITLATYLKWSFLFLF